MSSDFEKFRLWYRAQRVCAVLLLVTALAAVAVHYGAERPITELLFLLAGIAAVLVVSAALCGRYARCPKCGKSVLPFRHKGVVIDRIMRQRTIGCPHCHEELETGW